MSNFFKFQNDIDLSNPEEVLLFQNFISSLSALKTKEKTNREIYKPVNSFSVIDPEVVISENLKSEEFPIVEKKRTTKVKNLTPVEEVTVTLSEPDIPESQDSEAIVIETGDVETWPSEMPKVFTLTVDDIKILMAKKINNNRLMIKDKLTELKAVNLSTLDATNYDEFYQFLLGLSDESA